MKILLSASRKHFDPDVDPNTIKIKHSVGILTKLFYDVLNELGDVTYISDTDQIKGQEFDLICSWPRNFWHTTTYNKCHKTICFLNIAEPAYLKRVLVEETNRLGCKLSDCFVPTRFKNADLYFLIGGPTVVKQYHDAGYPDRIIEVRYRHNTIPFKKRDKNDKTIFLHLATTLGLRKGFWHAVEDFKKTDIDAELWCVGRVQNERFWVDYAAEADKDPRIKVKGWIDCDAPEYTEILNTADFMVFPSFGEGQPGTIIEACEGGCLPIISKEGGFPSIPYTGPYVRGDPSVYEKAHNMPNNKFRAYQNRLQSILEYSYNNRIFKNIVSRNIRKLLK